MVSLWHKKKDNPEGGDQPAREEDDHQSSRSRQYREPYRDPDERTRLLPRDNAAYLNPDDPAVSLNLGLY